MDISKDTDTSELAPTGQTLQKHDLDLAQAVVPELASTDVTKTTRRLSNHPDLISTVAYNMDYGLSAMTTTKPRTKDTSSSGNPTHYSKNIHRDWQPLPNPSSPLVTLRLLTLTSNILTSLTSAMTLSLPLRKLSALRPARVGCCMGMS